MKAFIEVIKRTYSIIKTHLCMYSDYRNYSTRLQYKDFTGWRNNNYSESAIKNILSLIFDDRQTDSDSNNIKVIYNHENPLHKRNHYIVEYNQTKLYIKIFNNYNLKLIFRDILRPTKSIKFFTANFELQKRGISVPEPVFALQKKILLFKTKSIVATKEIKDAKPFMEHYKEFALTYDKDKYLKEFARFLFLLNQRKIAHTDLLGNVFVRQEQENLHFFLIDNDAVKLFDNLIKFDYIKHFEGFYDFFVKKYAHSEEDWITLCREYIKLDDSISSSAEDLTEQVKNRKNIFYYIKT